MIYITSDLHFTHGNVIKKCNRPFADVGEMDAALIRNWNAVVSKADEVYILGDFLYKGNGSQANDILRKLRGKKYLVRGNHEKYLEDPAFDKSAFEWIKDYYVLNYKDARIVLFHYPILEWEHFHRKSAHCFGHVHHNISHIPDGSLKFQYMDRRAFNVCVDCNDYYPINAEFIYQRAFENPQDMERIEEG
jgi:calcineurin-like phosphoesterase family protein